MTDPLISDERLKSLLKAAVVEALEERRDLIRDVLEEALEDIAMLRAIGEGAQSPIIESAEVYKILES